MGSVSFDRAASFYDRTRGLPAEAMERLVGRVVPLFQEASPTVELGVGTGRVGLPLRRAGVDLTGVDISAEMLGRLRAEAADARLVRADATALPLRDGSFGSALFVHVLHLVERWADALAEAERVVRPGGKIFVDLGRWPDRGWDELQQEFAAFTGQRHLFPGIHEPGAFSAYLQGRGIEHDHFEVTRFEHTFTYAELIDQIAQGVWSFTWHVDEDRRRAGAKHVREWAAGRYGDLGAPRTTTASISWFSYTVPG